MAGGTNPDVLGTTIETAIELAERLKLPLVKEYLQLSLDAHERSQPPKILFLRQANAPSLALSMTGGVRREPS